MEVYEFEKLIYTDLSITFNGKSKKLTNVVIDTGAAQSILNLTFVEDLGIKPNPDEKPFTAYGIGGEMGFFYNQVDELAIGDFVFKDIEIDFGDIDPKGDLMGLIGLDLLNKIRAVIDVEIPIVFCKDKY